MPRQPAISKAETQIDDRVFVYNDDECVRRLAVLIEHEDSRNLHEIARLISRLAVPVE